MRLDFFPSNDFEDTTRGIPEEQDQAFARNVLRILFMGWRDNVSSLVSLRIFNAVLINRDPSCLRGLRAAFQEGFLHVFTQLNTSQLSQNEHEQVQRYLSNCLSLLLYADITPYESIQIPQYIDDQWKMVDYKVIPIELTPTRGFEKLFLLDKDRVFAYGLETISDPRAESHLVFMGTTYPAGQGFLTQVNTDLEAFSTPGEQLFSSGYKKIIRWLDLQGNKVHVCGTSLGGALSLLLAINQPHKLSRVDALNPPGLYPSDNSPLDNWDNCNDKPRVVIQRQGDDLVSSFGVWKNDWEIIHTTLEPSLNSSMLDHALNYAGLENANVEYLSPEDENAANETRNILLYGIPRALAYYLLQPFRYLIRPMTHYMMNHKVQLALIICFFLLPFSLAIPFVLSGLANNILSAVLLGFCMEQLLVLITEQSTKRPTSPISHMVNYLNQVSPYILPISVLSVAALLTVSSTFFPFTIPVILFVAVTLPFVSHILYTAIDSFLTLAGIQDTPAADLHSPALPRNRHLDIYSNEVTAQFTTGELKTYYEMKRSILKGKRIDGPSPRAKLQFFNGDTGVMVAKQQLLQSDQAEDPIRVRASKAKIHDIRKTLQCYRLFSSVEHLNELKDTLAEQDAAYKMGKPLQRPVPV